MHAILPALRAQLPAILEVAGAGVIGVGLHAIYPPAAWIWGGLACFGVSYTLEARARPRPPSSS